ncbi:6-carboxytetrahydropterin synthase [Acidiplasma sp.]|uniref:6-pyruvoyl trahydropterin synthase family protein n=1 Tax=Acidiplasma sp. TaxID=1872114 RepID=UPI003166F602
MFTIKILGREKNLTWSSGHYVPDNIKCRRLHGHDYALDVEIQCNEISENGMVIDFTVIKNLVKPLIDSMDHKFIIPKNDIKYEKENNYYVYVNGQLKLVINSNEAFVFEYNVGSAEYIAIFIYNKLKNELIKYLNNFKLYITVYEGYGNTATFTE